MSNVGIWIYLEAIGEDDLKPYKDLDVACVII